MAKYISYILQFIDRTKFIASSLSAPVNDFSERIYKVKCKYGHGDKKCENCGITYKVSDCFLEYTSFKNDLIEGKCLCCNENYKQKFDEKVKQRFLNTYKFFNHDNNKFILLLQQGVYHYEYMYDWEKFKGNIIKDFYSHLNMEDITDADHAHAKRVCKESEIKKLGKYHDFYVPIVTLSTQDNTKLKLKSGFKKAIN